MTSGVRGSLSSSPTFDMRPYWEQGSVCGLKPREPLTLRVTEAANGWLAAAHTGDGTKPGSLVSAAGGFPTAEAAFAWLNERWVHDA